MLKLRIIPILSLNAFSLVKTKRFANPRMLGNPIQAARVFNSRGVDELILCDIFATKEKRPSDKEVIREILQECFMPVGVGGGITTIDQISELLTIGADKVIIKTAAIQDPKFIEHAARIFGSQCICVSVDTKKIGNQYMLHHLHEESIPLENFVKDMEQAGAGELMITSVEHDGTMSGYDLELAKLSCTQTQLPIIFSGGAGKPEDVLELFSSARIDAAAVASMFYYTQYTPQDIKVLLQGSKFPVRFPRF